MVAGLSRTCVESAERIISLLQVRARPPRSQRKVSSDLLAVAWCLSVGSVRFVS